MFVGGGALKDALALLIRPRSRPLRPAERLLPPLIHDLRISPARLDDGALVTGLGLHQQTHPPT